MSEIKDFIISLGAEFSPPDIRDYKIAKSSIGVEFPEEFALKMPKVKNQGSVGSCVAHAIATTAEYFNMKQHNLDTELSVGYIYGNRVFPLGTGSGMVTRYAISNFCADGAPFLTDFPLHCEVPKIIEEVKKVKDSLHDKAVNFRFTSYVSVSKEAEMKTALMDGNPIIIAVDWYDDMKVKDGKFNTSKNKKTGGHAMVIYGWTKEGWLVQNSWGKWWGTHGTAIWPYDYKLRECYAIVDKNTQLNIDKPHSAKTKFGKWCVRICNRAYAFFYNIWHKIKN